MASYKPFFSYTTRTKYIFFLAPEEPSDKVGCWGRIWIEL